jgi:hypothetical protein
MKKITTLLFILASHLANAQINLKLNVQPGFKMKGVYDMTMKMSMMGKKMDMHALYYISGIANNTNDKKETEWTFIVDSLIMDSKQGKEVHHINSNDPKTMQDAPSKITDAVGKKILVMVDEFGNVKNMENKDESAMIIKSLFIQFAGKEIAKKEKWNKETAMDVMGQSFTSNTEFSIDAEDANTYCITGSASNEMMEDPIVTKYIVDKKTGLIQSCSSEVEMKMMGSIKTNVQYKAQW